MAPAIGSIRSIWGQTGNFSVTGFVAGATIGANFQTDALVFGAEVAR